MSAAIPKNVIEFLRKEFGLTSQVELAKFLGTKQPRISNILSKNVMTIGDIKLLLRGAYAAGKKKAWSSVNTLILDEFGGTRGLVTQAQLAKAIKKSQPAIAQWKNGNGPISKKAVTDILAGGISIKPLVEMLDVDPGKPGGKWYLFHEANDSKRKALEKEIEDRRGVYCYFDGRGNITYIGKADKTPLFQEMEARLNQAVAKDRLLYWTGLKKLKVNTIRQGDLVRFVSAYSVTPRAAIGLVEAILIRATANSQYNNRLENLR